MSRKENIILYQTLRLKHTWFCFEGFDTVKQNDDYCITFHFTMDGDISFHPQFKVPFTANNNQLDFNSEKIKLLLFHIGMIELVSYWKLACAPKVIIKHVVLNNEQINWFKKVYFNGLGEFFYLNGIDTTIEEFMTITCEGNHVLEKAEFVVADSVLIPVGGGKDSVVTLELLKKLEMDISCFLLNPRLANSECVDVAGFNKNQTISFIRSIDTKLIELNKQGYLNGHTPFSALLAFITILAAALSGKKNIALSNESSANEPTVGTANHQYSKSFEFENDFRLYVKAYITNDIEYFSFLRPLSELQIAAIFATKSQYFNVFKSCNAGSKTDSWCGVCSKCLFAFIILSPFIAKETMISIFGHDLLNDTNMQLYFEQLTGIADEKPFECIGTVDEVNIALCMCVGQYQQHVLPYLLNYYIQTTTYKHYSYINSMQFLNTFNNQHVLKNEWFQLLKQSVHEAVSGK